jgi:hypothetical protein
MVLLQHVVWYMSKNILERHTASNLRITAKTTIWLFIAVKRLLPSYPNMSSCWNVIILYCIFLPDMTSRLLQCKVVRGSTVTWWEPEVWTLECLLFSHLLRICKITFTANPVSRNITNWKFWDIWGSHGGICEGCCPHRCDGTQFVRKLPHFWEKLLPADMENEHTDTLLLSLCLHGSLFNPEVEAAGSSDILVIYQTTRRHTAGNPDINHHENLRSNTTFFWHFQLYNCYVIFFTVVCILLRISLLLTYVTLLLTYVTVYAHFSCLLSTQRRRYIHTSGDLEQEEVSERAIQWYCDIYGTPEDDPLRSKHVVWKIRQ